MGQEGWSRQEDAVVGGEAAVMYSCLLEGGDDA